MSTEVLTPLFHYFSPLIQAVEEPGRTSRIEAADSDAKNPILTAALRVVIGALTFVVLLLPSLLLTYISGELTRLAVASPAVVSLLRTTSNVLALIDLVLFLMYAFRSLLRAILLV